METFSPKGVESYIEEGYVKKEEVSEWKEYIEYWKVRNLENAVRNQLTDEEKRLALAQNTYMEVMPGEYTSSDKNNYRLQGNISSRRNKFIFI